MVTFDKGWPRARLRGQLVWFLAWVAVTVLGMILTPNDTGHGTHSQLGLPPCGSAVVFGRPCPGCGMTTSVSALVHLDVAGAARAHPLGPFMYALFTASAFASLYGFVRGRRLNTDSVAFNRLMWAVAIAFLAFGIARFALVEYPREDIPWPTFIDFRS